MTLDIFIQDLVKEAGGAVLKRFGKDGVHYTKTKYRGDAVTKADLLSEKIIISRIKKRYPSHGILAEESGADRIDAEYMWIIDPIDGTLNFSLGIPMFGVMVCLAHRGKVILSAIYLPTTKELYFAKAGKGAYLNGKQIHCAGITLLEESMGTGLMRLNPKMVRFLGRLMRTVGRKYGMMPSSVGSIAVGACYVACGRRDWMVSMFGKSSDHDCAPVFLILKESGCKVTDSKGNQWKLGMSEMIAANPMLHRKLLTLTRKT